MCLVQSVQPFQTPSNLQPDDQCTCQLLPTTWNPPPTTTLPTHPVHDTQIHPPTHIPTNPLFCYYHHNPQFVTPARKKTLSFLNIFHFTFFSTELSQLNIDDRFPSLTTSATWTNPLQCTVSHILKPHTPDRKWRTPHSHSPSLPTDDTFAWFVKLI